MNSMRFAVAVTLLFCAVGSVAKAKDATTVLEVWRRAVSLVDTGPELDVISDAR